ncbi:MAG: single-stranded-DNA-specific exonuclease RecJ [Actinomycetota bacterium]|nr:single-stranded-DNA-specific exonuclease RecJ [Actinomycetota bacterium]
MESATWTILPCSANEVRTLADELGLSHTVASVLARRGYDDVAAARSFLDGALPGHDPLRLGDMREAVAGIRAAVEGGARICVHGDYDADGICATALAVFLLRELGADPAWHLPSRFEEGYGLASQTLSRLAGEGVDLVLTVDCGITAVAEVEEAKRIGLELIVTDHHRPGDTFPDCPVVAPLKGDYPFTGLCGTAVVWKLAEALLGSGHPFLDRHLDVVALATVADVVPLVDESRGLALAGLRRLAQTQKRGLLALMRVAGVDPAACDEGAIGFRLAPRINAAGRLGRPEAALSLLLTEDDREAATLAEQLEELNRERQVVEERILRAAIAEIESWPDARRRHRGYVVAGEDWHEGVIGIVASRLAERFAKPVVLIAGTAGNWKGSGRAGGSFDLHGALEACSGYLERFGGHRAAAGLTIRPEQVDEFAAAFAAHADEVLSDDDLRARVAIDAIVPGSELGLALCEELARLAPFGLGNPGVTLLVDACELTGLDTVGEGKHLRFRVRQRGRDAGSAIAFGFGGQLDRFRRVGLYDVAFRLQENHWNGTVSPQLVVRRIFDTDERYEDMRSWLAEEWRRGNEAWTPAARAVFEELELGDGIRRSLHESEAFRRLLEEPPLAAAA